MPRLLQIEDLRVHFRGPHGVVKAVDGISYGVDAGETVALVGESGCGKSMSALAVLGLVPRPAGQVTGAIRFEGTDLLTLPEERIRDVRGRAIAMVFQEPMTSLNPVLSISTQLSESMRPHLGLSQREATRRAVERAEGSRGCGPDDLEPELGRAERQLRLAEVSLEKEVGYRVCRRQWPAHAGGWMIAPRKMAAAWILRTLWAARPASGCRWQCVET